MTNADPTPLAELLGAQLERADAARAPEIEPLLQRLVEEARAAWPALSLSAEAFIRRLAAHYPVEEPLAGWLAKLHAADLYLASACVEGVAGAIDAFDRALLRSVPEILQRSGPGGLQADEIRQRVRERLFVGAAKIRDYSGRGALVNWVEVVTLRIAIDAKRQEHAIPTDESGDSDAARLASADPELEYIKEHYRDTFKSALRSALEALSGEQRNLLKLHFVDGVTLDQLAELLRVHRATIARRIATARQEVFDGVRKRLQTELALGRDEFDSLLAAIRSRLELSLSALLDDSLG